MSATTIDRRHTVYPRTAFGAWATIAGALLTIALGIPLAHLQASTPVPTAILGLNALSHLLLMAGVAGLARSGAAGHGRLGTLAPATALGGLAVLTLAEVAAMVDPNAALPLYGLATLLIAVGLIVAGVAVLRTGRWSGWQRLTPLATGLFVPLVLGPAFALPGYASHYAIGAWGVCWLLLGLALRTEGGRAP